VSAADGNGKRFGKVKEETRVFLTTIDGGRTLTNYRKNDVIFSQGDPADAVFYIRKGKVKLVVASKQGKQAVVAILGEGGFFGEGCLNGQSLRLATAHTMTESELMRVQKSEMVRALHGEPAFAEMFKPIS
jgi:CRP-like cAMP-binding protein